MAEWQVLLSRPDALARIVAGALESEGIPVRLSRDGFGAVYGLQHGRFGTRVLVPAEDLPRARALLAEVEASEPW
ncbi:MAG TPA: DUF2007 domain-containing protein [Egibacteraceae bacterium]